MNKKLKYGSILIAASIVLAACQSQDTGKSSEPKDSGKKSEEVTKASFGNFPTFGYDYGLSRHVPYSEITKENVKDLGVIWSKKFRELDSNIPIGNQSYPIVVDGVAYVTTSSNYVFAFDAITGDVIWKWTPPNEIIETGKKTGLPSSNRGVAVADGKVFMITNDVGVVSIDAKTGKTDKFVHLKDYFPEITPENGYYETTAPVVANGKIFIGSSGGDNGVRGFEMALKTDDLTPAWDEPFWTVPPKGEGWLKDGLFGGGGAVWMPPSYDQESNYIYISVGNPAPDFYGKSRPGANPHTDSVVALDANTGKLIWAQQQQSHDLWDYDTADSPTIMTAKVGGEQKKIVAVGTKGGEWFAYDAKEGTPIYKNVAFNKIDHPKPTAKGVKVYPGVLGGQNYAPDTFDPKENLTLIPSIEQPMIMKSAKNEAEAKKKGAPGIIAAGTSYVPLDESVDPYGKITAIDLDTGKIKWDIKTDDPQRGGLTSTETGLTFYGELDGKVKALETATGKELWSFQTNGNTISAAPSIFEKDGKQYLIITTASRDPQVYVFGLGGDKTQGTVSEGKSTSSEAEAAKKSKK